MNKKSSKKNDTVRSHLCGSVVSFAGAGVAQGYNTLANQFDAKVGDYSLQLLAITRYQPIVINYVFP